MPERPILVVSGLGNAVGTGAASARLFASKGYRVALLSRPRTEVDDLRNDIVKAGFEAEVFSLIDYDHESIRDVFERVKSKWPSSLITTTIWNTGAWSMIPFMEIKESDIKNSVQINIVAATAFAQQSIQAFLSGQPVEGIKSAGTIIFTGATSAWRGSANFGAFAAGKHGLRAISQSIAREYGPKGIHSAFVVIDGTILTKRTQVKFGDKFGANWMNDEAQRLSPESIAKCYWYLHEQEQDAFTLEMDLRQVTQSEKSKRVLNFPFLRRPSKEKF